MKKFKKFIFEDLGDTTWIPRYPEPQLHSWRPLFHWMRDYMTAGTALESTPINTSMYDRRFVGMDLQPHEERVLGDYIGWSGDVNQKLRDIGKSQKTRDTVLDALYSENTSESMRMHSTIKGLDQLIRKRGITLPHDLTVYRSLPINVQSGVEHGFLSTSLNPQFAAGWGIDPYTMGITKKAQNKILQLTVPKGTKFLPIHQTEKSFMSGENELLFPRGMHIDIGDKFRDIKVISRPEYTERKDLETSYMVPLHKGRLTDPEVNLAS